MVLRDIFDEIEIMYSYATIRWIRQTECDKQYPHLSARLKFGFNMGLFQKGNYTYNQPNSTV